MNGILIFDHKNDLIFKNLNNLMEMKLLEIATTQNLMENNEDPVLDNNIIIQIFVPLISSQKIMFCQFDNAYSSIQCEDNLNFIFNEFLGYMILCIGNEPVNKLKRLSGVVINFAKSLVGPNLFTLKFNENISNLLIDLITNYKLLHDEEQTILLEGIDPLIINNEIKKVINNTLKEGLEKLQQDSHSQRCHIILFVSRKIAAMYSSRYAQKLCPADMLFCKIFNQTLNSKLSSKVINIQSHLLFLQGHPGSPIFGCIPCITHLSGIDNNGLSLLILIEYGNLHVSNNIYDTYFQLQKTQNIQMQNDLENLKSSYDNLDTFVKQINDSIKRAKYNDIEIDAIHKKFSNRWDALRKKYIDFFKNSDSEKDLVIKIESNMPLFYDDLRELFKMTCFDCKILDHGFEHVSDISTMVEEKLLEFSEFLNVKAQSNHLSMVSYLEEFPGLAHFIYIDRTSGTIVAPDLPKNNTSLIPKENIWNMIELSRSYLAEGQTTVMWKDTTFSYSYFLWFEDQNGQTIKPKEIENSFSNLPVVKQKIEPGILGGDFYRRLCETCFPKITPSKIKCFEIYCIHLGIVTATCSLEHARRLVATITDVTGDLNYDI